MQLHNPIQENCCYFQTNDAAFISFEIYNVLKLSLTLFYDWLRYLLSFGFGGAVKAT